MSMGYMGYHYTTLPSSEPNPSALGFVDSTAICMQPFSTQQNHPHQHHIQHQPLWKSPSVSDLTSSTAIYNRSANCRGPLPPTSLPLPSTADVSTPGLTGYSHAQAASHSSPQQSQGPATSSEIDRIMAKIEQDNRILAELDKTRSTIGKFKCIVYTLKMS